MWKVWETLWMNSSPPSFRTVRTAYGPVREKVYTGFGIEKTKIEYEDRARLAAEHGLPLREIR